GTAQSQDPLDEAGFAAGTGTEPDIGSAVPRDAGGVSPGNEPSRSRFVPARDGGGLAGGFVAAATGDAIRCRRPVVCRGSAAGPRAPATPAEPDGDRRHERSRSC